MPIRVKGPTADRHPRRPWDSPERRRERQKEYMKKHGEPGPRRKTLGVTDKHKKAREQRKFSEAGFKTLRAAKATGGRIGLKEGGGWPKGGPKKPIQPMLPDYWKDRLKDVGKRFPRPKENLIEKLGGSEKAKPHSTKEGRVASGERRIRRILKPNTPKPLPKWKLQPKHVPAKRAKKGIGGKIVQKIINKIKPKPKPGKVDQKFLDLLKQEKV